MRVRGERPKRGLAMAIMTAVLAGLAIFALPAAANPPDPDRPDIELSAVASVDRPFTWTISKTADAENVTLQPGQTATVNYTVTVAAHEGPTGFSTNGRVFVYNKEDVGVTVNAVTVDISGVGPANVTCNGPALPRTLNSGAEIRCFFDLPLPDDANRTATATAFVNSSTYSATALVDFADHAVDNRIDHCVEVHDTNVGLLAEQICVNKVNKTETYSLEVGPYDECGEYEVANTAWFVTNHTETTGEDKWNVKVNVPCPPAKCKIGDYVWHDEDGNGKQDSSLAYGINGVLLELLDADGYVIATTVTGNNPTSGKKGWYNFEVLCGVGHRVRIAASNFAAGGPLVGMVATTPNVGSNDAIDSDGDALTFTSHLVTVASGSDLTVDFGLVKKPKDDPCGKYDKKGYNKCGYDKHDRDKDGRDKCGYDKNGYDKHGRDKYGRDKDGYDKKGRDKHGYSKSGYSKSGYDKSGYDKHGYNKWGKDKHGKYRR